MNETRSFSTPLSFSRLILGTAQFGLNYGVANQAGRPSFETVCEILRVAQEGGVNGLDTSPSYGDSEKVIGRALKEAGLKGKITVVTKIPPLPAGLSVREASEKIEASVVASLKNLGLECLPLVLFHSEKSIGYAESLLRLRDKCLIAAAGVSLVTPAAAQRTLSMPELAAWQIPSNLLDRRYTHSGLLRDADARKITVLVRSLYLQGLLLMEDHATPQALQEVIPARQQLRDLAAGLGISLAELAVRGLLGRREVQSFVMGCETAEQVRENLAFFHKGPLPDEASSALESFDPKISDLILNPPLWPQNLIVKP